MEQIGQHYFIDVMNRMDMINFFVFFVLVVASNAPHSTKDKSTFTKGNLATANFVHTFFTLMLISIMINFSSEIETLVALARSGISHHAISISSGSLACSCGGDASAHVV